MNYHSIYDDPIVFRWTPNVPLEFFTAGRLYVLMPYEHEHLTQVGLGYLEIVPPAVCVVEGVSSHYFGTMQTDEHVLINKGALCVALGTAIDSFYKEKFAVLLVRDCVSDAPVEIRVRDNQFGRALFKEV